MRKSYVIVGTSMALMAAIYFSGLYTYFIRTEVQEAIPASMDGPSRTLASGTFGKVDLIHKGSGTAKLVAIDGPSTGSGQGMRILRLEDFNVVSGPDLYVYLTKAEQPTGDLKSLGDFIDLGPLKALQGNQNYTVRADIDGYRTAVIWCRRYGVLFTYALMH